MHATLSPYQSIRSSYLLLRDAEDVTGQEHEKLIFHIQTGDYFAMTATALGFIEERLAHLEQVVSGKANSQELALLQNTRKNLQYVNEHYTVCPKMRSYSIPSRKKHP